MVCLIYNTVEGKINWKMLKNNDKDAETVLDSSYAYISNNPVIVQLINKSNTCKLKVNS